MSEFDEEFDSEGQETPQFEPDPGVVAYLDQQGAAFAEARVAFKEQYGFDHECRCAQDYSEGKLSEVTECYLGMVNDALDTCAAFNWENKTLQGMVTSLVDMNNNLVSEIELLTGGDGNEAIQAELDASLEEEDTDGDS